MILPASDPRVTAVCSPVEAFDDELADVIARLRAAMVWSAEHGRPALGLAAPQIGETVRVFVLRDWPDAFVNPAVLERGPESDVVDEGCLSLPRNLFVPVRRARFVKVEAFTANGERRVRKHRDLDARCVLHELDHLDGIVVTARRAKKAA